MQESGSFTDYQSEHHSNSVCEKLSFFLLPFLALCFFFFLINLCIFVSFSHFLLASQISAIDRTALLTRVS